MLPICLIEYFRSHVYRWTALAPIEASKSRTENRQRTSKTMSSRLRNKAHVVDVTKAGFVSSISIEVQTHALSGIDWTKLGDEWIAVARLEERIVGSSSPP